MSKLISIAKIDEINKSSSKAITVEGQSIALFCTGAGEYYAIENSCPHAGVPLDNGDLCGKEVSCIWHQWVFDLETGESTTHPGAKVKTFPVTLKDDQIFIEI